MKFNYWAYFNAGHIRKLLSIAFQLKNCSNLLLNNVKLKDHSHPIIQSQSSMLRMIEKEDKKMGKVTFIYGRWLIERTVKF
jgi:uncharacterized membrane protein YukC